jgi:prepilin-type N-terminal cleavage/methylation domain-containing protein
MYGGGIKPSSFLSSGRAEEAGHGSRARACASAGRAPFLLDEAPAGRALPRRSGGFTLVEVIVVLVILAILAAIAIPALTGYIDKAEDKKYIADARNMAIAMRAVIDDAYAEGTFGAGLPAAPAQYHDYLLNGESTPANHLKSFYSIRVAEADGEGRYGYLIKATALMGMKHPRAIGSNEHWDFDFYAPNTDDYTFLNAPAWGYLYYPNERITGEPVVIVTYGIKNIPENVATINAWDVQLRTNGDYDPNAGYKVYHLTYDW